ncbi:hypothetical protein EW145_g4258 [Phellinidium pouzarii]|uniref:Urea carboxylase n=1 Tax=Phellinidium pouzarii TaxID=167371 RepID=A0A4S4L9A1_9AGAM|nr:hypothetical protein EW145_g4258 [Phellinidium pouzarii]
MSDTNLLREHKLLIANRGEIAVRIIRTARRLGLHSVAIYTQVDATAPHVILADEAVLLLSPDNSDVDSTSGMDVAANAKMYLDAKAIVRICIARGVTLVHPGYGFLSENTEFSQLLAERDITLLGPSPQAIKDMGLKHRARALASEAGVPVVPGSSGLLTSVEEAEHVVADIGFPVMLKATAGGGGMGLVVCRDMQELKAKIPATQQRAKSLFHNEGIFIEKLIDSSRHIEVQIFGDGFGHVIHMGERECSVQRRHQKIIEEAPSPYLFQREELREEMCAAAVKLGKLISYKSAGTVEFLVDGQEGKYYFLEMNTRLQVEHGVTEMLHPGLDIVELMIRQGVSEYPHLTRNTFTLLPMPLDQKCYAKPYPDIHAIELRIYCENPASDFSPSPGILQYVEFPKGREDIRVDSWVSTGITVSPYYDPLIAKVIASGSTRVDALAKLVFALSPESDEGKDMSTGKCLIQGPPNNIPFLYRVLQEPVFKAGKATTDWVDSGGVMYTPSAFTVLSSGINTTVQSLPIRDIGLGISPSGPMDPLAFQAGNALVGNSFECEGLELVSPQSSAGRNNNLAFSAIFHVQATIAVTGTSASVTLDGKDLPTWSRLLVSAGSKLIVGGPTYAHITDGGESQSGGLRTYLSILGGFPGIPKYLGSKSTSMGVGGYQGRALQSGDMLQICAHNNFLADTAPCLPRILVPKYPSHWTLYSLPGPHDDTEFLTAAGIEAFYHRKWKVSSSSNRMGIRLEPLDSLDYSSSESTQLLLDWARLNGGEGGSHPSNILDNGYARGSVNLNGDTPVILTNEGPSMGGYTCISTVATADQWKFGQLRPGDSIQFVRISYDDSARLSEQCDKWLETVLALSSGFNASSFNLLEFSPKERAPRDPKLHNIPATSGKPKVVFRQAGDSAILVEYGEMKLDFAIRARIHAFETAVRHSHIPGIKELAPCIRSTMVHYDSVQIKQSDLLSLLINVEESLPVSTEEMQFPGRKLIFPIVLDDKWNKEAVLRYMRSTREKASYLPSNIDYLARNNGVEGGSEEALRLLVSSPWLVFGVGFYLACPFLVPVDPRCRLVGQKMNPSRTFTPRGSVGIAGLIAAIYPVESPGGYQLFGRTLPTWQAWGKGHNFTPDQPWLLEPFDQVVFDPVSEEEYILMEKEFDSGRYTFKIEPVTFSMSEYLAFIDSIQPEITSFKERQAQGVKIEEAREQIFLDEWEESKRKGAIVEISADIHETSNFVTASLSGSVWQIKMQLGDIVDSPGQVVIVLEAMKTEISVLAGEDNVGLKVVGFGRGVNEGRTVKAGDKLVFSTLKLLNRLNAAADYSGVNQRVEDDMRPVIQSAMRNTTSVSKQKNEASQKEVEYLIKKPSLKRKNVEELDGSHFDLPSARKGRGKGNREHSPEFARNSSSAPKHLNDIVQAPPVLKSASRLKRLVQKAKVDNDEGEDTGDSNNVVSNAQKRMMELEREKVIVRYRALKEMRLKQRQKVTGESGF